MFIFFWLISDILSIKKIDFEKKVSILSLALILFKIINVLMQKNSKNLFYMHNFFDFFYA